MISQASPTLFALKNIQEKQTKANVVAICKKSFIRGSLSSLVTALIFLFTSLKTMASTKYAPFNAPHIINVQLAPCHKPLIKNTKNKLKLKPTLKIIEMITFEKIKSLYDFSRYFKVRA